MNRRNLPRCIAVAITATLSGCVIERPAVVDVDVHTEPSATKATDATPASGPPVRRATGATLEVPEPFIGTWRSADGSILRLSETSFYLRFPHESGIRENFGTIVEVDEQTGHILIRYDKSLFNGAPTHTPSERGYMTYAIQRNVLRKWIAPELPFREAASEEFVRTDDDR